MMKATIAIAALLALVCTCTSADAKLVYGKNSASKALFFATVSSQLWKSRVAAAGCPANCKKDAACKGNYCCTSDKEKPCEDSGWFQRNECELVDGEVANVGCGACVGKHACNDMINRNIGENSCTGGYYASCYYANDSTIGDRSCHGYESCRGADNNDIGNDSCHNKWSCYNADDSVIHSNSCHGKEACENINNVVVYSNACIGDFSCKGLQSQTACAFGCRRALTAAGEEVEVDEVEEDPSPPKIVIPENTCVGDGSCKDCQYLLEKFPGRCNNELSPSDVSPEHGNVCKLCRVSNVFRGMAFPPTHIISSPFAFSITPFHMSYTASWK